MKFCRFLQRIVTLTIFSISPAMAQVDTEFWFVAPEVSIHPGALLDRPIFLRFTTYSSAATVTVSQPAGGAGAMPTQDRQYRKQTRKYGAELRIENHLHSADFCVL
jgi:hypothetical protein